MGTAYIDVTVRNGEWFEIECTAEVEYTTDGRTDLDDFHVRDFLINIDRQHEVAPGRKVRIRTQDWCSDQLRPVLLHYVDRAKVEEALREHLIANGQISYPGAGLRADYHRAVM